MTIPEVDCCYYLKTTTAQGAPRKYASILEAKAALHHLLELQAGRGFTTTRDRSGKYESRHTDGRQLSFWLENGQGEVVT